MNVSVARAPLLLWAPCPCAGVWVTGQSPSRGPPLSHSDLGAGPCLPITLRPRGPGACRAGLRLKVSPSCLTPHCPHSRARGRWGGVVSCLLSPCSFGCFSCCVWIPIKLKKLLQLLGLDDSIQGVECDRSEPLPAPQDSKPLLELEGSLL